MATQDLCTRCGSPRIVTKTWIETIKTFNGDTKLTFSQMECTNKECQEKFDKNLIEENKKRDALKAKKEEQMQKNQKGNTTEKKQITLK